MKFIAKLSLFSGMFLLVSLLVSSCSESTFSGDSKKAPAANSGNNGGLDDFGDGADGGFFNDSNFGSGNGDGGGITPGGDFFSNGQASAEEFIAKISSASDVQKLCDRFEKKTHNQHISFPATHNQCAWGAYGNLGPSNGYHMGRHSQTVQLTPPDQNAVICSMTLNFPTQTMRYDDGFFMTFGNFFVMGIDLKIDWEKENGLAIWDWNKHKGYNGLSPDGTFCIDGPGTCRIPVSESTGALSLSISDTNMKSMTASLAKTGKYGFTLIIVGDDDASDCQHSGFSFSTTSTYVVPEL